MMLTLPPKNNVRDFPMSDVDAELAMVAGMLQSQRAADEALALVAPDSIRDPLARLIFLAIGRLRASHVPVDVPLVWREARMPDGTLTLAHLNTLAQSGRQSSTQATIYHAKRVAEIAQLQALAEAADQMLRLAYSGQRADEAIGQAQALLQGCAATSNNARVISLGDSMLEVWNELQSGTISGIPTGFRDLDGLTGGWHATDLNLLAARPGYGKTACALDLIAAAAAKNVPVFLASQEMGHKQISGRMLSKFSQVNGQAIRLHTVHADDMDRVYDAVVQAQSLPVTICDQAALTTSELRTRAHVWRAQNPGPALVVVDYIQLMRGVERVRDGRVQEIGEISGTLKALAKNLDVPVIALSQLNRAVEGRSSHIPVLSDLRESGNLEQDADMVIFIHREEMSDPDTDKKGIAELHIAKQRNGPLGVVPLRYDAATTTFSDLTYRTMGGYE
jgi:replicative DNA helicase